MLKLLLHRGDGRRLLTLGLTGENITRLVAGECALVRLDEFGIPGVDVILDYGKTSDAIIDTWRERGLLDEETAEMARAIPESGGRLEGLRDT